MKDLWRSCFRAFFVLPLLGVSALSHSEDLQIADELVDLWNANPNFKSIWINFEAVEKQSPAINSMTPLDLVQCRGGFFLTRASFTRGKEETYIGVSAGGVSIVPNLTDEEIVKRKLNNQNYQQSNYFIGFQKKINSVDDVAKFFNSDGDISGKALPAYSEKPLDHAWKKDNAFHYHELGSVWGNPRDRYRFESLWLPLNSDGTAIQSFMITTQFARQGVLWGHEGWTYSLNYSCNAPFKKAITVVN